MSLIKRIIFLIANIFLLQPSQQRKAGPVIPLLQIIQNVQCGLSDYAQELNKQIISVLGGPDQDRFINSKYLANPAEKWQPDPKIFLSEYIHRHTAYLITDLISKSNYTRAKIAYGFVGLPQYFVYQQQMLINKNCTNEIIKLFYSDDYFKCKICSGKYFSLTEKPLIGSLISFQDSLEDVIKYRMKYPSTDEQFVKAKLNILEITDQVEIYNNMQQDMVEAFQVLWNCNNPNDKLNITKLLDDSTVAKLKRTPSDGFNFICNACEDRGCWKCEAEKRHICIDCRVGYIKLGENCVQCQVHNCASCEIDGETGDEICTTCKPGYFIQGKRCVQICDEGYTYTATSCLKCEEGFYPYRYKCEPCNAHCKFCDNSYQCKECFPGYLIYDPYAFYTISVFDQEKAIEQGDLSSLQPKSDRQITCQKIEEGSKCQTDRCPDGFFKQSERPYQCQPCHSSCLRCKGPASNECITCKNAVDYDNLNGYCISNKIKMAMYTDEGGNEAPCFFSCGECSDGSELCDKCNEESPFYIAVDRKFKCYDKCPEGQQPEDPEGKGGPCIEKVTVDLFEGDDSFKLPYGGNKEEAQKQQQQVQQKPVENNCPITFFLDPDTKQCVSCKQHCLNCNYYDQCDQCSDGYYWDQGSKLCEICHFTCSKCSGKTYADCIMCTNIFQIYPSNGVCNTQLKTTYVIPEPNNFKSSLYQLLSDLPKCELIKTQPTYTVDFQNKFYQRDEEWASTTLMQNKDCLVTKFEKKFPLLESLVNLCTDDQLSQSTISSYKGQQIVIYSIVLAQFDAVFEAQKINPGVFANWIKKKEYYSTQYVKKLTLEDDTAQVCQSFACEANISNQYDEVENGNGKKLYFKETHQINLLIDCFSEEPNDINASKLYDVEKATQDTIQSEKDDTKQFLYLTVCGVEKDSTQIVILEGLVQKYYGNGLYEVIFPYYDDYRQTQKIYILGATIDQNIKMKKCNENDSNARIVNNFEYYKVSHAKIIRVQQANQEFDRQSDLINQMTERVSEIAKSLKQSLDSKCQCQPIRDYILQQENQTQLYLQITEQGTMFTKSLSYNELKPVFEQNNVDYEHLKNNKIAFTNALAEDLFQDYLYQLQVRSAEYYGYDIQMYYLCVQDVLVDYIFCNNGQPLDDDKQQLKEQVKLNNLSLILTVLKASIWCETNPVRCTKAETVLLSCM